jgi:predicted transcriptional regulator
MAANLLKNKANDFLKLLAWEILVYENSKIDEAVIHISKRIKISEEKIRGFISFLYRHGFLVKYERGQKYALTLNGVNFLLSLAEDFYLDKNLEGGKNEHTTS